jgi:hypothetical protein
MAGVELVMGRFVRKRKRPDIDCAADEAAAVLDALADLPREQLAVIRRAYCLGWSLTRIADDMDIPEALVICRLHDGLRALRCSLMAVGLIGSNTDVFISDLSPRRSTAGSGWADTGTSPLHQAMSNR